MEREITKHLLDWKDTPSSARYPLMIRGARQIGKTFTIERFGEQNFESVVSINFEESPEFDQCFNSLSPQKIIESIEIITNIDIEPGKTLLFFDEIQKCPRAIMALRYFKEKLPTLHVISAGSLLEFALREEGFSMPVGRVQYLYFKQLSFIEFLFNSKNTKMLDYIRNINLDKEIPEAIHKKGLELVRQYMILGGMPKVLQTYFDNKSYLDGQRIQNILLTTYKDDFSKYAKTSLHKYLDKVYQKTPSLVGSQIKYSHISQDLDSRYLKIAIDDLSSAGVIFPIFSTSCSGLPLNAHENERKFKLLFLDVGLLQRSTKIEATDLLSQDLLLLNQGAIAEQLVGQELLSYQNPFEEKELFYWSRDQRGSSAEVDYIIRHKSEIIPIEVKAGKTGSLRSLHLLLKEKNLNRGLRISSKKLEIKGNILSVPFYLISKIPQLLDQWSSIGRFD